MDRKGKGRAIIVSPDKVAHSSQTATIPFGDDDDEPLELSLEGVDNTADPPPSSRWSHEEHFLTASSSSSSPHSRIIAWLSNLEATTRAAWTTGCLRLRYYNDDDDDDAFQTLDDDVVGRSRGAQRASADSSSSSSSNKVMPLSSGRGGGGFLDKEHGVHHHHHHLPRRRHSHPILSKRKLGSLLSTILIIATPALLVLCVKSLIHARRRDQVVQRHLSRYQPGGGAGGLEQSTRYWDRMHRRSSSSLSAAATEDDEFEIDRFGGSSSQSSFLLAPDWLADGGARFKDGLEALTSVGGGGAVGSSGVSIGFGLGFYSELDGDGPMIPLDQDLQQRQRRRRRHTPEGSTAIAEDAPEELPFWGSSDVVGPSPFDHEPALEPGERRRRRLLFLTDYHDYLERMNTHTYEIVDAALRHPLVDVDVWGPKWKHWDSSLSVAENVRRRSWASEVSDESGLAESTRDDADPDSKLVAAGDWMTGAMEGCPARPFDMVFTISNIFDRQDPKLGPLDCGSLLIQQLGDCHELRCMDEWYPHASNITVTKYAFEVPELFEPGRMSQRFSGLEMQLYGHSPDSANPWDFWPIAWKDKVADARVFGFDGSFYPLRTTVTQGLDGGNLIDRFQHPGYTISTDPKLYDEPLETYTHNHESYANHRATRQAFAQGMRESRICVFDASLERKMIRKYAQALLSGCVIAGDLPTEHEDELSEFVIRLDPSWPFERVSAEIERALADPDELRRKSLLGFAYARRYLTNTHKISLLVRMADQYRAGKRGYDLPFGFSLRCRAYWSEDDAYRP